MYETYANITVEGDDIFTCDYCESPCKTCEFNATDCLSCVDKYLYYDVDHTCYEEIIWYFPFIGTAVVMILFTWMADCCARETDILHSLVYFLGYLENATMGYLAYKWVIGEVPGDRSLAQASFAFHLLLNWVFVFIHCRGILAAPSPQYRQLRKDFWCTFWCCNVLAYALNFKMALILVSYFCGRVRFAGRFTSDNWQQFNTFSVLYILLVYLPLLGDFYRLFTEFGMRTLVSYISAELVAIETIIALILLLEVLTHCTCGGMIQKDLGKRAGLHKKEKGKKGKESRRKALRSGMGNEEDSYGDESSSSDDDDEDDEAYVTAPMPAVTKHRTPAPAITKGETTKGRQSRYRDSSSSEEVEEKKTIKESESDSSGDGLPKITKGRAPAKKKPAKKRPKRAPSSSEESGSESDSGDDSESSKSRKTSKVNDESTSEMIKGRATTKGKKVVSKADQKA
jgi:hypothetical protein